MDELLAVKTWLNDRNGELDIWHLCRHRRLVASEFTARWSKKSVAKSATSESGWRWELLVEPSPAVC
jgi:hypothetical protein